MHYTSGKKIDDKLKIFNRRKVLNCFSFPIYKREIHFHSKVGNMKKGNTQVSLALALFLYWCKNSKNISCQKIYVKYYSKCTYFFKLYFLIDSNVNTFPLALFYENYSCIGVCASFPFVTYFYLKKKIPNKYTLPRI